MLQIAYQLLLLLLFLCFFLCHFRITPFFINLIIIVNNIFYLSSKILCFKSNRLGLEVKKKNEDYFFIFLIIFFLYLNIFVKFLELVHSHLLVDNFPKLKLMSYRSQMQYHLEYARTFFLHHHCI